MGNSAVLYGHKKNIERIGVGFSLLMLYLILGTDSLLFSYNANSLLPQLSEYFMVTLSLCMFEYALLSKRVTDYQQAIAVFAICVWMVFLGIVHSEFSGGYISKIALFLLGFSFFSLIDSEKFVIAYCRIMRFICVISLIGVALSTVIIKIGYIPTLTNTVGHDFKCLLFTNVSTLTPFRNYGPFSEPSRFQAYINMYVVLLLFKKRLDKNKVIDIIIALLTLVTTFSTTGFIAFALIVLAFVFQKNFFVFGWKKFGIVALIIIALIFLLNYNENFIMALNKITMGSKSLSFTVRFNSIVANLKIIAEHLFLGTGIRENQEIFANTVKSFSNSSEYINTNTILLTFAKFGIVIGGYYSWNLIKTVKRISKGVSAVLLFVAFFATTSGISFLDSMIFNIIVYYYLTDKKTSTSNASKMILVSE